MPKVYFHNKKSIDENINAKRLHKGQHIDERQVVDINKLLNRVRVNQKNEKKQKLIYFIFTLSLLSLFITFIFFK